VEGLMMIHNEDNTKVEMKITDDGQLLVYCPECKGVWETSLQTVHKPKEARPITYGGTGINLDMGSSESVTRKKSSGGKAGIAKELFPEAFK